MKRITDIVSPINSAPTSSMMDQSNFRDRDQNEIVVNGLLDTVTK